MIPCIRTAAATSSRLALRAPTRQLAARSLSLSPSAYAKQGKDKLKPGQVDEHARIFDPDSRAGTAAAATSEGADVSQSRPTDIPPASKTQAPGTTDNSPLRTINNSSTTTSPPAPDTDAGSSVDPGYISPSSGSDPFPLPFDSRIDLASPSQSDSLTDYGAPLRVPGREPGNESREQRIRRLIYQTRKRGILETDLLMSTFAQKELWSMPEEEVEEFDRLLDEPDWDLYYWLVDRKPVPARWKESFEAEGRLGFRLRRHTKNEEKAVRWMPDELPASGEA